MGSWFGVATVNAWPKGVIPSTSLRFGLALAERRAATTAALFEIAAICNGAFLPPRGAASMYARPCASKRATLGFPFQAANVRRGPPRSHALPQGDFVPQALMLGDAVLVQHPWNTVHQPFWGQSLQIAPFCLNQLQ